MKANSKLSYFISTDPDLHEISTMSVDEVQAGLRQFGLQPTKDLPEELKNLLLAAPEVRRGFVTWAKEHLVTLFVTPSKRRVLVRIAAMLLLVGLLIVAVRRSNVTHPDSKELAVETQETNSTIIIEGGGLAEQPKQPLRLFSTNVAPKQPNLIILSAGLPSHRDPGSLDITHIPFSSFNVGLNDHVGLFFKTRGYRDLKLNSSTNPSGFYLPNARLLCSAPAGCSPPAFTLAPNVSANLGYIINSNPNGPDASTLLDHPNELIAGVGFDFPSNDRIQPFNNDGRNQSTFVRTGGPEGGPTGLFTVYDGATLRRGEFTFSIAYSGSEGRSTQYLSDRTPNALENNNPVDALAGVKIYPRRWWGIGAAYRMHLNPQDHNYFNTQDFNTRISQASGAIVPGQGIIIVPQTARPAATSRALTGFRFPDDPEGFIGQFWIAHRNVLTLPPPPNQPPTVSVSASTTSITLPRPEDTQSASCKPSASRKVQLTANASDPDNDTLLYAWSVTGGRISGDGRAVTWDLSGVNPGTYSAQVKANDGNGNIASDSVTVIVSVCDDEGTGANRATC